MNLKKIKFRKVKLVPQKPDLDLFGSVFQTCGFCGKQIQILPAVEINAKLSGKNLFCSFCLRSNFYTANNHNVLILTFKNIFGYFYFEKHLKTHTMWVAEIESYINIHQKVGLLSPFFHYDAETMCWFLDFSKIGTTKKKAELNELLKVIVNILSCFNLAENVPEIRLNVLYLEYKNAITDFYLNRKKPIKPIMAELRECLPASGYYAFEHKKAKNFDLRYIDNHQ